MRRKVIILTCLLCLISIGIRPMQIRAYTDEEIRQGKAWLAAHGYPVSEAGAQAAYNDYLNGKWDEELGINSGDDEEPEEETDIDSPENEDNEPSSGETEPTSTTKKEEGSEEENMQDFLTMIQEEKESQEEEKREEKIKQLEKEKEEEEEKLEAEEVQKRMQRQKEKQEKRQRLGMCLIGIALVCIAVFGFFLFRKKKH